MILSSVHRTKWLEAQRVYLLRLELPHPRARTPGQQRPEENFRFAACTRPRRELFRVRFQLRL